MQGKIHVIMVHEFCNLFTSFRKPCIQEMKFRNLYNLLHILKLHVLSLYKWLQTGWFTIEKSYKKHMHAASCFPI